MKILEEEQRLRKEQQQMEKEAKAEHRRKKQEQVMPFSAWPCATDFEVQIRELSRLKSKVEELQTIIEEERQRLIRLETKNSELCSDLENVTEKLHAAETRNVIQFMTLRFLIALAKPEWSTAGYSEAPPKPKLFPGM